MKPALTIAIPTYQRIKYLKISLSIILEQVRLQSPGLIEVIVSENCGDDGSWEYLKTLNYPGFLRINRNQKNIGSEGNFYVMQKMARGQYIWLLGDDDFLVDDAINCVLDGIRHEVDCLCLNFSIADHNMTIKKRSCIDFNEKNILTGIDECVGNIPHMAFGFISAWISKTNLVFNIPEKDYRSFSFYGLSFMVDRYLMLSQRRSVFLISKVLLNSRKMSEAENLELNPNYNHFQQYIEGSGKVFEYLGAHGFNKRLLVRQKNRFLLLFVMKRILYERGVGCFNFHDSNKILYRYFPGFIYYFICLPIMMMPGLGLVIEQIYRRKLGLKNY